MSFSSPPKTVTHSASARFNGGHHGGAPLVAVGDQIEEELAAMSVKRDESGSSPADQAEAAGAETVLASC